MVVAVAIVAGIVLAGAPARAQGEGEVFSPQVSPAARLRVSELRVAAPDDAAAPDLTVRALVENRGAEVLDDLTLLVEVFAAVSSRSELHQALDRGTPATAFLDAERADLEPLAPREVGAAEITVPGPAIGWGADGVHPVRITVVQGREALDEVTSAAILDRIGTPLRVVVGWPLDAPPTRGPGGVHPATSVTDAAHGGRLERLVWALESAPDLRVQPLLGGHLFEDLTDLADGFLLEGASGATRVAEDDSRSLAAAELLERVRGVLDARAAPLASPYADADLAGLAAQDLAVEGVQHITSGRQRLERTLGTRPVSDALWATAPLTTNAVRDVIGPARINTLVLSWSQLHADLPARTPAPVRSLLAGGNVIAAVVGDPWFEQLLAALPTGHGPHVAAQRVLAETAMVHLERPFDRARGLVLLPPPLWDPDPRAASEVLTALAGATWLEPVSVEALVVARTQPATRGNLVAVDGRLTSESARSLKTARDQLGILQETLADPGTGVGARAWRDLDTQLLRAASFWLADGSGSRRLVDDVAATIAGGFGTVDLAKGASVTLTAEEGTIPVSLSRPEGAGIRVLVEVESSKLDFPQGRVQEVTLDAGGKRTISFPTVAHASGRIPVTVRVVTPRGGLVLDATTVVVRSSHVSSTALAVLGAVLAGLLLWWLLRRRRPRPPRLRVVEEEAA